MDIRCDDWAFVSLNESASKAWKQRTDKKVEGPRSFDYLRAEHPKKYNIKAKENEEKREGNLWRKTDTANREDEPPPAKVTGKKAGKV